jgi:RNA polymerase sigma factor (sigma-70 family)
MWPRAQACDGQSLTPGCTLKPLHKQAIKRLTEPAAQVTPALPSCVRTHLGEQLRALYRAAELQGTPALFQALLKRFEAALEARGEALTAEVRAGLITALPNLRAYALSLTRDRVRADDLVQETMLKGWRRRESYQAGTNLTAWLTTIMRNTFYSGHRKRVRESEDPDDTLAAQLSTAPSQGDRLDLQDLQTALGQLPEEQRAALRLVVIDGLTYEEAAELMGCPLGTVKSRINRSRQRLAELLGYSGSEIGSDWLSRSAVDHALSA